MSGKVTTERMAADDAGIRQAVRLLQAGRLVGLPTETVYGLAARADDERAVQGIYRAKGRPGFNPLIVHVAGLKEAERLAAFSDRASELAQTFWPGPLTLVLPRRKEANIAPSVTAGLPTIALRMPAHPVMRCVLEQSGLPLAAPSANTSGLVSPTCAEHVLRFLDGRIDAVLDAGPSEQGLESTIIAVRPDGSVEELRPGPIDPAAFKEKLRRATGAGSVSTTFVEAPGQLASHYAPGKPLRLNAHARREGEFFITFGTGGGDCDLSPAGSLTEAGARLYACLHTAALSEKPRIAVAPLPEEGIGRALNDRLRRAAR
ncbi:L-threonylcarbamoyladenylate synthase [Porphyrobacter sp. GA68]|uniref:L-threonylcarbamoyladenylate synthase n=1 Tax=Porphyrobacter sp. GA68 TaxID=2883480 RepID=UPI001D183B1E|nr:L-threonylcarbamoyladenylate synthase [Porphyrobacter sp. GA68]